MKKFLIILISIAIVFCINTLAGKAEENANSAALNINATISDNFNPGILPDSPFYFLKQLWEKIRETFTLRSEAKLQYMEKLGEKRAAEAQKLIEKGKPDLAEKIMGKYNFKLQKMEQLINNKGKKLDKKLDAIGQRIKNRFEHRNQVLEKVMQKAPEKAKPGLQRALDNSKKQLQNLQLRIKEKMQKRDELNQRLRNRLENINAEIENRNENINSSIGIANPATVKCQNDGGIRETYLTSGGEAALCVFPDKSICEEWAYFNGECKVGQCQKVCRAIGTRSEGWYDSCTDQLIKYDKCASK